MKILLLHNFHRGGSSSGDDVVVNNEVRLLRQHGHSVFVYSKNNSDFDSQSFLRRLFSARHMLWSNRDYGEVKQLIADFDPDVVHVHTFFPLLSPSVYVAAHQMGVPIVQTLHDYRFFCPGAFLFRDGMLCEDCVRGGLSKAVLHRCFQGSFAKTLMTMLVLKKVRRLRIFDRITAYVAFTEFGRRRFTQLGIPSDRIHVKPHFLPVNKRANGQEESYKEARHFLFLGRTGEEKGLRLLMEAWRSLPTIPLKIAGSGPLQEYVKNESANRANVEYLGFVPHDNVTQALRQACAVVVPSLCEETFGLVIMEAYAVGTPVIASNCGAMAELVAHNRTGLLIARGDKKELVEAVSWLWDHSGERAKMSVNARQEFESKYTANRNHELLMQIYQSAIATHGERRRKWK